MVNYLDRNVTLLPTNFLRRMNLLWLSEMLPEDLTRSISSLDLIKSSFALLQQRSSLHEKQSQMLSENDPQSVIISNSLRSGFFEISNELLKFFRLYLERKFVVGSNLWKEFLQARFNSRKEKRCFKEVVSFLEISQKEKSGIYKITFECLNRFKQLGGIDFRNKKKGFELPFFVKCIELVNEVSRIDSGDSQLFLLCFTKFYFNRILFDQIFHKICLFKTLFEYFLIFRIQK